MLSGVTHKRPNQREASDPPQGAVHWFFLFWFGLIFGQAMIYRFVSQLDNGTQRELRPGSSSGVLSSFSPFLKPYLTPAVILVVFLGLMALHGGLHWLALFTRMNPRSLWGYVVIQLLCIFCISTVAGADNLGFADDLALGLSLIMVMEVFLLSKHLTVVLILAGSSLVFGMVMQGLHI
jgi:hypothetical protein